MTRSSDPPPQEASLHRQSRSNLRQRSSEGATTHETVTSSSTRPESKQPTGYSNFFATRALLSDSDAKPPSYAHATHVTTSVVTREGNEVLPRYTCTVSHEGVLAVRYELVTPFKLSTDRQWHQVYAVLRGTQLNLHRVKTSRLHKSRQPCAGALLQSYTLQHAEVGVAADFRKTEPVPRYPFVKLFPASTRQKAWESDPHLFEPPREHVLRLRAETKQMLFCAEKQEELLNWVEKICVAIDISQPLDDRSEPRFRSLPRRRRRRDGHALLNNVESLGDLAAGRRLVAEQERIIREMYPHLAERDEDERPATSSNDEGNQASANLDPEADDLDPADFRDPASSDRDTAERPADGLALSRNSHQHATAFAEDNPPPDAVPSSPLTRSVSVVSRRPLIPDPYDPKTAPPRRELTPAQLQRYRRRCAAVLLATSPRVTDIVMNDGMRMRVDMRKGRLVPFELSPPRYGAHGFAREVEAETEEEEEEAAQRRCGMAREASGSAESIGHARPASMNADTLSLPLPPQSRLDGAEDVAVFGPATSTSSLASAVPAEGATEGLVALSPISSTASSGKQGIRQKKERRKSLPRRLFSTDSLAGFILPKTGAGEGGGMGFGLMAF